MLSFILYFKTILRGILLAPDRFASPTQCIIYLFTLFSIAFKWRSIACTVVWNVFICHAHITVHAFKYSRMFVCFAKKYINSFHLILWQFHLHCCFAERSPASWHVNFSQRSWHSGLLLSLASATVVSLFHPLIVVVGFLFLLLLIGGLLLRTLYSC